MKGVSYDVIPVVQSSMCCFVGPPISISSAFCNILTPLIYLTTYIHGACRRKKRFVVFFWYAAGSRGYVGEGLDRKEYRHLFFSDTGCSTPFFPFWPRRLLKLARFFLFLWPLSLPTFIYVFFIFARVSACRLFAKTDGVVRAGLAAERLYPRR